MDTSTVQAAVDTLGRRVAPRHFRTVEEKIRIVTESRLPGASVAEVARRYGVSVRTLDRWLQKPHLTFPAPALRQPWSDIPSRDRDIDDQADELRARLCGHEIVHDRTMDED